MYELQNFKKKLAKYDKKEPAEIVKILKLLKGVKITPELLQKSQISSIVSKLAKNKSGKVSKDVQKEAVDLRVIWKKQLTEPTEQASKAEEKKNNIDNDEDDKLFDQEPIRKQSTWENKIFNTDKIRNLFCKNMMKKMIEVMPDEEKCIEKVVEFEEQLHTYITDQGLNYPKYARERLLIITDRTNGKRLTQELASGTLSIEDLVKKKPKHLLSDETRKQMKDQIKDYKMKASQMDFYIKNTDFKEGEFQCYKCKGKKVLSRQQQTRSADEPMTTFFTCLGCDFKWKM